jgi:hypothetical protein
MTHIMRRYCKTIFLCDGQRATLNEAKKVVNIFHRQVEKKVDLPAENAHSAAVPSDGGHSDDIPTRD